MPPFRITYVGHATVLIELDGMRLLTDPLLRPAAGPLGFLRRANRPTPPGRLDAVLISHLHADHYDPGSLDLLEWERLVVPRGAAARLGRRGFANVEELAVGEEIDLGGVSVRATPAQHGRLPAFLRRDGDPIGYLVDGTSEIYFAGDTDTFPEMATLSDRLELALLPIWGWGPTLGAGHLDPFRAAQALRDLRPRAAVPIHWGTLRPFSGRFRPRYLREPAQAFASVGAALAPSVEIRVLEPGETTEFEGDPDPHRARGATPPEPPSTPSSG